MAIVLPSQLNELLEQNDRLNGSIHSVLALVVPWFADNKLVFFPEYTDHGPKHISEVLSTAEALVSAHAWGILSPEDVATLVLAIILHDSAMHLSEDGFITLITQDRVCGDSFKDRPWRELWREFLGEARRFDARKLNALFGDTDPVQEPPLDPLQMTKRDRLLIGEFLRRHHPRLANEIALTGIPGSQGKSLSLGDIPDSIRHLAGVAARSHGLDLRICVDYLNSKSRWGARRTMGIHISYLMTLVRIADYLQIHRERAPAEILKIRSLKSPVSRGEWDAHDAIVDIHQETDDPEALWIAAAPRDVKTYLKIRDLLKDIQRELDDSWAVLGEVYGPKQELRNLGLTIRRIKSNLDDTESFAKTVSYIPRRAALEAVGADLLQLLIEPLYGAHPEIGIRELLQNAVDACRELKDYLAQHPNLPPPQFSAQDSDILISIEEKDDGSKWITVSDKGIGMTVDTLLNYFLKAGASFRNSDAWRKQHEDEQGNARVLRSGRFGIGVLAGFLLGEEIHISTRHITAPPAEGIAFTCKLMDDTIEFRRVSRGVGTTITVQLTDEICSTLLRPSSVYDQKDGQWQSREVINGESWDWYCLEEPSVARVIPTAKLPQKYQLPCASTSLPPEWRIIEHPDLQEIHWSYLASAPELVCNGIAVRDFDTDFSDFLFNRWHQRQLEEPRVSVFDPRGRLPLNLQRTRLTIDKYPFEDLLLRDISRDFIAYILVNGPEAHLLASKADGPYYSFHYPGLRESYWYWCAPKGISLLTALHLEQTRTSRLYFIPGLEYLPRLQELWGNRSLSPLVPTTKSNSDVSTRTLQLGFSLEKGSGRRILMHRYYADKIQENSQFAYREKQLNSRWVFLEEGDCLPVNSDEDKLYSAPEENLFPIATVFLNNQLSLNQPSTEDPKIFYSMLIETWQELIQQPYIPYDLQERRDTLGPVYKELAAYIEAWEKLKEDAARA